MCALPSSSASGATRSTRRSTCASSSTVACCSARKACCASKKARNYLSPDVQAVVAARLDTLPPEYKAAALRRCRLRADVLEWRRGCARRARRERDRRPSWPSSSNDSWCVPRRSLPWATNPSTSSGTPWCETSPTPSSRRARVEKHTAVARWLEDRVGERVDDIAEVLARHYTSALDLVDSLRIPELRDPLVRPALRFLTAGDRAMRLDVAAAEGYYAEGLRLTTDGGPDRVRLLCRHGEALHECGRFVEAATTLEAAVAAAKTIGEVRLHRGLARWAVIERDEFARPADDAVRQAVSLLENDGPSADLAAAYAELAVQQYIESGDPTPGPRDGRADPRCDVGSGSTDAREGTGDRGQARCDLGAWGPRRCSRGASPSNGQKAFVRSRDPHRQPPANCRRPEGPGAPAYGRRGAQYVKGTRHDLARRDLRVVRISHLTDAEPGRKLCPRRTGWQASSPVRGLPVTCGELTGTPGWVLLVAGAAIGFPLARLAVVDARPNSESRAAALWSVSEHASHLVTSTSPRSATGTHRARGALESSQAMVTPQCEVRWRSTRATWPRACVSPSTPHAGAAMPVRPC